MRTTSLGSIGGLLLALVAVTPAMAQDYGSLPLDQFRAGPPARVAPKPVIGADVGVKPVIGQNIDPLANFAIGDSAGSVASAMTAVQAPDLRATMPMPVVSLSTTPSLSMVPAVPTIPTIVMPQITVP